MQEISSQLEVLAKRLSDAHEYLRIEELRVRRPELESLAAEPGLWDDPDKARATTGELTSVTDDIELYERLEVTLTDAQAGVDLGPEFEDEVRASVESLSESLEALELRSLFTGDHDESDAVCHVQSGAGGTDAQDWAEMLVRMYTRWAERRGFTIEVTSWQEGTEAGISSAEFIIRGRHAFGLMRGEGGVHRLVRISPFNKEAKRQTAFASVQVVPLFDAVNDEIDIDETELRIDTFRSSGAGGQHVNVTDSAVRITHLPTGLVTSCQNERSQHQNKDRAMQMLASKLLDLERQKREDELAAIAGESKKVDFGSQIRSYVLQPYQMVKDLRTEHETGNVEGVLGGAVEPFMESYLQWARGS